MHKAVKSLATGYILFNLYVSPAAAALLPIYMMIFSIVLMWIFILSGVKLNELLTAASASTFVSSVICGILCIILGIVSMVIMNGIYKGMLSDCLNRSVSGEFIERNDENA
ncbi:hypothetical protein [Huintestinicola sp.]|uniref:hypothetical protein n=1 Tax=Huintestinicola sp. TaxID=2981661 RepID=UPI003D7C90DA